jgi:glycolate oxidase FAD binding subunit
MSSDPSTFPSLTPEQIQQRIADAQEHGTALAPVGGGTKRGYGRAVEGAQALDVRGLGGIVDYQPQELIVVARPGTPLAELEALLAERRQMLAFEPPHWGAGATLGGAIACNLAGPRRFKAGAARDHLLGFQAVTGRGELIRGGGRVVKNVTGYDMSKLLCGSFGTLAVLTELCVKVLPRPEAERTLAVTGLAERAALALLGEAARTQQEPSGLAYLPGHPLPPGQARPQPQSRDTGLPEALRGLAACVALLRVEGPERAVAAQADALAALARERGGRAETLDAAASRSVWHAVRELEALPLASGERLWRFSVPAAAAADLADALRARLGAVRGRMEAQPPRLAFDWAGGLVWAALPPQAAGGHARLVRSTAPVPPELEAFTPLDPARRKLHEQLKRAFDPSGILSPGRMYAGL